MKKHLSLSLSIHICTANGGVFELVMFDYRKRYFVGLKKHGKTIGETIGDLTKKNMVLEPKTLPLRVHRIYQLSYRLACSDSIPF